MLCIVYTHEKQTTLLGGWVVWLLQHFALQYVYYVA